MLKVDFGSRGQSGVPDVIDFKTCKSEVAIQLQIEALKSLSKIARQIVPMSQPSQHQIFGCNEN